MGIYKRVKRLEKMRNIILKMYALDEKRMKKRIRLGNKFVKLMKEINSSYHAFSNFCCIKNEDLLMHLFNECLLYSWNLNNDYRYSTKERETIRKRLWKIEHDLTGLIEK